MIETADAAANASTTYNLSIGQTAGGTIGSSGDHDWYRINLIAGQTYTFAAAGTGVSTVHLHDPVLYLRDSAGNQVAWDDDGGPGANSSFTFTASTSGTYYLDVAAYSASQTGTYTLSTTTGSRAYYDETMGAGVLLRPDLSWSSPGTAATISYGFRQSTAPYTVSGSDISTFSQLTPAEIAAVQTILGLWSSFANITFTQVNPGGYTDSASMLFANYTDYYDGAGAFAFYPGSTASSSYAGDVWLNTSSVSTSSLPFGGYSFFAIMHEVGHAIGLAHPGDYNAAPGVSITYANSAQFIQDTQQYTIMSYFDETYTGASSFGYADAPMLFDIYAIQQLYGANFSTNTGNTTYGFNSNAGAIYNFSSNTNPAFCIWDAGGTDTLDCSGYGSDQVINLHAGTYSNIGGLSGNVAIAFGATIEYAFGGSGNDYLLGNEIANWLRGNGGDDTFQGYEGDDTIDGGAGTDTAVFSGFKSQYQITQNADGSIRLVDLRAGSPDGMDTIIDVEFFQFVDGTFSAINLLNSAPVVTAPDITASVGATLLPAASLFSVSDADGDSMTLYEFYDATAGGGYFIVNGVAQTQPLVQITAAQLAQTQFQAGSGTDMLYVRAFDGTGWSSDDGVGWTPFHVSGPVNHAPVVTMGDDDLSVKDAQWADIAEWLLDSEADSNGAIQFRDVAASPPDFSLVRGGGATAGSKLLWNPVVDGDDWQSLVPSGQSCAPPVPPVFDHGQQFDPWTGFAGYLVAGGIDCDAIGAAPPVSEAALIEALDATDRHTFFDLVVHV
ncbi:MAG: M10 family metallopeptidase C-terminal domain-containing protein [Xanthobacteraceae bacterium]